MYKNKTNVHNKYWIVMPIIRTNLQLGRPPRKNLKNRSPRQSPATLKNLLHKVENNARRFRTPIIPNCIGTKNKQHYDPKIKYLPQSASFQIKNY